MTKHPLKSSLCASPLQRDVSSCLFLFQRTPPYLLHPHIALRESCEGCLAKKLSLLRLSFLGTKNFQSLSVFCWQRPIEVSQSHPRHLANIFPENSAFEESQSHPRNFAPKKPSKKANLLKKQWWAVFGLAILNQN